MLFARCMDKRRDFLECSGDEMAGRHFFVLISIHSRDIPCTSAVFLLGRGLVCFVLVGCSLLCPLFGFREFNYANFNSNGIYILARFDLKIFGVVAIAV